MTPERERLVRAKMEAEERHVYRNDYTHGKLWRDTMEAFQKASAALAAYDAAHPEEAK